MVIRVVHVRVEPAKGRFGEVLGKLRRREFAVTSANKQLGEIFLNIYGIGERSQKFKDLKESLRRMRGVNDLQVIKGYVSARNAKLRDAFATNDCHIILDVDSTITRGRTGTIHPAITPILQKLKDRGIWIYAATGRSSSDLANLISRYPIQQSSIAENGGIILGFGQYGYIEHGSKSEPMKVLEYVKRKYGVKEDMDQGERITEVIFLQKDIAEDRLNKAIKDTKARVAVHKSQNSYHISAKNIDKGSAVLELADRMRWGNSYKIAVGDSQLDVPMFEVCDYSFAPKNCDKHARDACSQVLGGSYERCLADIYDMIAKSG